MLYDIKKRKGLLAACLSVLLLLSSLLSTVPAAIAADAQVGEQTTVLESVSNVGETGTTTPAAVSLISAGTDHTGTKIQLEFDRVMADPAGKQGEFTVLVDGASESIEGAALGNNPKLILLSLSSPIRYLEVPSKVILNYTKGSIRAADGSQLESFSNLEVRNNRTQLEIVRYEPAATEIASDADSTGGNIVKYRFDNLMDYQHVNLAIYFTNGFFKIFEDNLKNFVRFYEKDSGEAVVLPNVVTVGPNNDGLLPGRIWTDGSQKGYMEVTDWYFWQVSGAAPLGLSLKSRELKPSTTYVIEVLKGFAFNNSKKTANTYSFEFTTTPPKPASNQGEGIEVKGDTSILPDGSNKNLSITRNTPERVSIAVPQEVRDAKIHVKDLLHAAEGKSTTDSLPKLDIQATTTMSTAPVRVSIEQGTKISGPETWDGVLNLPIVQGNNTVTVTADANKTAAVSSVIEVGAGDTMLQFDKAVRILLPGQAGKEVGFVRNGLFTKISTVLPGDSQAAGDALPAEGEGKIDAGNDLVLWTKHFTRFVTYTQTTVADNSSGTGTGSTSESGTGPSPGSGTGATGVNPGDGKDLRETKISEFKPSATLVNESGNVLRYRYDKPVAYDDVELVWYFTYGFFATFESNLEKYVRFYNKETGKEVELPNRVTQPFEVDNYYMEITDWWFEKISGRAPLGLTLKSTKLEPSKTYVIEIKAGFEFNNGNKTDKTYIFEFTTTEASAAPVTPAAGTALSGGLGAAAKAYTVSTDGGTVGEAGVSIAIPSGAFKESLEVELQKVSNPETLPISTGSKLVSDVIEIKKNKAGEFSKPVTITLPYTPSAVNSKDYDISLCWYDEGKKIWVELDKVQVDTAKNQVKGEVLHFTKFAVLAKPKTALPAPPPTELTFSDIAGHWAEAAIKKAMTSGAMNGYPDQTFKPEKSITRAEFATTLVKALKLEKKEGKLFKDASWHWAKDSISTASAYGIINGYDAERFGPDELITREQMAMMIGRAKKMTAVQGEKSFKDEDQISLGAKDAVAWVSKNNIMSGYPDNSFHPKVFATRAEVAAIIARI